jgi:DNA-binding transcriptional ArsR family regulator
VTPTPDALETRLAKALSHPLRARLLMAYTGRVASPSEVADELGESLGDVSYHTKRLVEHGCAELVESVRGRGGVKHRYRATVPFEVRDAEWAGLPPALRQRVMEPVVASVLDDVGRAAEHGGLTADDAHVSRTRLQLDAQGRRELAGMLERLVDDVLRLQAESAQRTGDAGGEDASALAILHLPMRERG